MNIEKNVLEKFGNARVVRGKDSIEFRVTPSGRIEFDPLRQWAYMRIDEAGRVPVARLGFVDLDDPSCKILDQYIGKIEDPQDILDGIEQLLKVVQRLSEFRIFLWDDGERYGMYLLTRATGDAFLYLMEQCLGSEYWSIVRELARLKGYSAEFDRLDLAYRGSMELAA